MPLYEYKCDRCDSVFEVIQKFSDEPLSVHQTCGGTVERLISASAFQFKGSGWYVNDYAKKGANGGASGKSNGDSSKSDAKVESKAEAKSEAKSESKPAESKPAASTPSSAK